MCMEDVRIMRETQVHSEELTAIAGQFVRVVSPNVERVTLSISGIIPVSDGINIYILTERGRFKFRQLDNSSATDTRNWEYLLNIFDHGALVTAGFEILPNVGNQVFFTTEVTLPKK